MPQRLPFILMASALVADAQWIKYPTPGIPRTPNGKPNLSAPAPRTADGKPDLSGLWQVRNGIGYSFNVASDLKQGEILPYAEELYRRRSLDCATDDRTTVDHCCRRSSDCPAGNEPYILKSWVSSGSGMNDAALNRCRSGLRPVLSAQFAENVLDVVLRRACG